MKDLSEAIEKYKNFVECETETARVLRENGDEHDAKYYEETAENNKKIVAWLEELLELRKKPNILFLCDKQKEDCEKTNCSEEFCHHTSDVSHAINFKKIVDTASGEVVGYAEKESGWIPIKMRPGTDEEYEEFSLYGDCPREDFRVFECQLPDDNQKVLVTTRWGDVCIDTWYRDVDCCYFEDNSDDDDVIAWMPLPEGYKSEVQHEDS